MRQRSDDSRLRCVKTELAGFGICAIFGGGKVQFSFRVKAAEIKHDGSIKTYHQ